jgi:GntR family transcriptional regulator
VDFTPGRGVVPLYRQLAQFITDAIEDGRLQPGDGLPGEQNIADSTGVSVDTVRAAFRLLREAGYIETATGIGSFIAQKPAR